VNEKALTLRDHEVRQLLTTGEVLIVRPVKPQPTWNAELEMWVWPNALHGYASCYPEDGLRGWLLEHSPYPIGSRWWVRETWRPVWLTPRPRTETLTVVQYSADYEFNRNDWGGTVFGEKWESPILLSRAFSRMDVEVVEHGAGRVQEIGEDMAVECGVSFFSAVANGYTCRGALAVLWDRHNPQFPYDSNPWTWTTRVRRIQ